MNDFAVHVLTAPIGKTWIFSVGQAGFIVKSANGQLLGIDLYLSECVERIEKSVGFKRLLPKILAPFDIEFDILITTHPHFDHFDPDSIPQMMSNQKTLLFASQNCKQEVVRLDMPPDRITYVAPGATFNIGDFLLNFVHCDHGMAAPDAVGVVVEVDKKRICLVGDTCLHSNLLDEYMKYGALDVLVAPINGAYGNLNEQECAELSGALNPRLTIPCHYGMFAAHGGNPWKFAKIMQTQYPNNAFLLMSQGERVIL